MTLSRDSSYCDRDSHLHGRRELRLREGVAGSSAGRRDRYVACSQERVASRRRSERTPLDIATHSDKSAPHVPGEGEDARFT